MTQTNSAGADRPGSGPLAQKLRAAAAAYERGALDQAESLARQILAAAPALPDALHILGLVDWRRGRRDDAVAHVRQAIAARSDRPQPHNSLGVMLRELGDLAGAEQAFRAALSGAPDQLDALTNLGNVLGETGRFAEAEMQHRRAIALAPGHAEGHNNLATVLSRQERWDEATIECRAAVALQPNRADFHLNLGNALSAAGQWSEAAAAFRQAVTLNPAMADAHAGLGIASTRLERLDEAAAAHRRTVELQPSNAKFWSSLSFAEVDLGNSESAIVASRRAIALDPHMAEPHNSLGAALKLQGRLTDAIAAYRDAILLRPDYGKAYNNLGVALNALGRFEEAMAAYDQAASFDPDYAIAQGNRGLLSLLLGDFDNGWRDYESRLRMTRGPVTQRYVELPAWQGESLSGKTLLLWSEQGIGDQIMFAGLLPELIERGAFCIIEADPRLEPLFRRTWPGLAFRSAAPVSAPVVGDRVDLQSPLGGICRWLRFDLDSFAASRDGYLKADTGKTVRLRQHYRDRLGERPIVGVSWRGGTGEIAKVRSIALTAWLPILRQTSFGFVNLQYGDCRPDLAAARDAGVTILHDEAVDPLGSLDDFAAQVAAMDLVISVDNTTVHMAGALSIPTWVLLPKVPDWRWLLEREDSPWYPSVRLFRQHEVGEWRAVIDRVAEVLRRPPPALSGGS